MNTAEIEQRLHAVTVGEHAKALLEQPIRSRHALVVLPSVVWVKAVVGFGERKQIDGKMPVRVSWTPGPLLLLDESGFVAGHSRADARNLSFKVDVLVRGFGGPALIDAGPGGRIPSSIDAPLMVASRVRKELVSLVERGHQARWELWTWATSKRWIRDTVERAVRQVSAEMRTPEDVLDRCDIDSVVAHIELDHNTTMRTIDRYCSPRHVRPDVDFMRALKVALKRDTLDEIRRRVDDPAVGPAVRKFIGGFAGQSLQEALDGFNRPRKATTRVSYERFARSLDPCGAPRLVQPREGSDPVSELPAAALGSAAMDDSFDDFLLGLVDDADRLRLAARRVLADDLRGHDAAVLRSLELSESSLQALAESSDRAPATRSLRAARRRADDLVRRHRMSG